MGSESQRQLNEAVIPSEFSLESIEQGAANAAALRLTDEGWDKNDANRLVITPAIPQTAEAPISSALTRGTLPLVTSGKAEFGLNFGRRNDQPDEERDLRARRGKAIGLYGELKF